jgi:tetratricopeptide (TPR) repeat protein
LILIPHYEIVVAVIATLYFIRSASYSIAWEDNVKLFGVNLRNQKNSVEAHVNLGDQLVKLHNCVAALPILQRAVELDSSSDIAWFNIGAAYVNLGDAVSARDCWSKAIKVNPKYVSPRYNLMRLNESVERQGGWERLEREKQGWRELEVANK